MTEVVQLFRTDDDEDRAGPEPAELDAPSAIMLDAVIHTKRHGAFSVHAGEWKETPLGYFLATADSTIPYGEVTLIEWEFPNE